MSAQFGRWNFDGISSPPEYLEKVGEILAPFGPDAPGSYSSPGVDILYHAFHTTKQARAETQPYAARGGEVFTWDGRLDNREELMALLGGMLVVGSPDVVIVAAAYERWGDDCLAKFLGDWALSIFHPGEGTLLLAKDSIGARPLYYACDKNQATWSSLLDPLVLLAGRTFSLDEEYVAGWLSHFPPAHLTPYAEIRSVPPSSCVRLSAEKQLVGKYWDFPSGKTISYRNDAQYEEHFLAVFAESVRRRLRSDAPVLAELSGGMDSSAIVCMADRLIARGAADTPRLDTISYYDDSEPNWNERPYFTKVEQKRGRAGCHIDVGSKHVGVFPLENERFHVVPGSCGATTDSAHFFADYVLSQGHRVLLSGMGGDEVLGGVPTPVPELADLLARLHFKTLAHQLKAWAFATRLPWIRLLCQTAREFFPTKYRSLQKQMSRAPWLNSAFFSKYRHAFSGYPSRLRLLGPLPSVQQNLAALEELRRSIACSVMSAKPLLEKRYSYLDRDLLEFLYRIPREQLIRPGQRRSLMRRSLQEIVPEEILNRRRKAFVARNSFVATLARSPELTGAQNLISASMKLVDASAFRNALQSAPQNRQLLAFAFMRTLALEVWLRQPTLSKVLTARPEPEAEIVRPPPVCGLS